MWGDITMHQCPLPCFLSFFFPSWPPFPFFCSGSPSSSTSSVAGSSSLLSSSLSLSLSAAGLAFLAGLLLALVFARLQLFDGGGDLQVNLLQVVWVVDRVTEGIAVVVVVVRRKWGEGRKMNKTLTWHGLVT